MEEVMILAIHLSCVTLIMHLFYFEQPFHASIRTVVYKYVIARFHSSDKNSDARICYDSGATFISWLLFDVLVFSFPEPLIFLFDTLTVKKSLITTFVVLPYIFK
jgi:hypothetical protein